MTPDRFFIGHAAIWLILISLAYGCQSGTKPSTLELLLESDSVITSAAETVEQALVLGTLDPKSGTYGRIYKALKSADAAMDAAWSAYRAGDMIGADGARRTALDAYMAIRPLLAEAVQ